MTERTRLTNEVRLTTDQLLERMGTVMRFKGYDEAWTARAANHNQFAHGPTPRAAMEAALVLAEGTRQPEPRQRVRLL